jgi:hypothetical protein
MRIYQLLKDAEGAVVGAAAGIGPALAPIPTAYAVGHSVVVNLGWPTWLGYVAAAVIELLGLAAANTALMLRDYNASKRKSDPRAPFELAAALAGTYLVATVMLAVLLDAMPALARWTPAVFPLLSLSGMSVLALRSDHRKRTAAVAQDRARRRNMRKERRQRQRKVAQDSANIAQGSVKVAQDLTLSERRVALLDLWRQGEGEVFAQVAPRFGVSRQTISNDFAALEARGRVRRNGQGIEVLT